MCVHFENYSYESAHVIASCYIFLRHPQRFQKLELLFAFQRFLCLFTSAPAISNGIKGKPKLFVCRMGIYGILSSQKTLGASILPQLRHFTVEQVQYNCHSIL